MDNDVQARADEVRHQIVDWIKTFRQPAWVASAEYGDGGPLASKYAGVPYLAEGESWPLCASCHRPLEFFLQLNLAELPMEVQTMYGTGLLQLFYCMQAGIMGDGQCRCEGYEYFAECHLTRIVQPVGAGAVVSVPEGMGLFRPKTIVRWKAYDDFPHSGDLQRLLGLSITYTTRKRKIIQVECAGAGVAPELFPAELRSTFSYVDEEELDPIGGEKLGGWPNWLQTTDYPDCPTCGTRMRLIFQTLPDLEYKEPTRQGELLELGDGGRGYIMQCPNHPDVLSFGWQCW